MSVKHTKFQKSREQSGYMEKALREWVCLEGKQNVCYSEEGLWKTQGSLKAVEPEDEEFIL